MTEAEEKVVAYWRRRLSKMRDLGFRISEIAKDSGWSEHDVLLILRGKAPLSLSDDRRNARKTGMRMLENPSKRTVDRVFSGNVAAYRKCVLANFGDVLA